MAVPTVALSNGAVMPQVGFGLWKVRDQAQCLQTVKWALESGFRHFDTAQAYGNEAWLGTGLSDSDIPRHELFITTKIAVQHFGHQRARRSFQSSLQQLQLDHVDLLLLHFPVPLLRNPSWRAVTEIQAAGKARAIGVSNFTIKHLEKLRQYSGVVPAVNQVELHVFLQQPELLDYCRDKGIVVEAYSPLAHGRGLDNPVLAEIGRKYSKTPTQIMLRWCVEQGTVPLPKSVHQQRIAQNIAIFDFSFDAADKLRLKGLEQNLRTCWSPVHVP